MNGELIKVEYLYGDGSTKWIMGEELQKWLAMNALVAQTAEIHGVNPDWQSVKWKKNLKLPKNEE